MLRIFCAAVLVFAAMAGADATGAQADTLKATFPAPDWKRGRSPAGLWVDCVTDRCGRPAHAVYVLEPASPEMASRIKSGAINREWAEQLAASFKRSEGDEVAVVQFDVQTGRVPGWTMVYRCHCEGRTSYVSSQIMLASKGMMTFYSMATTPEAARENMQKLVGAVLGPSSR